MEVTIAKEEQKNNRIDWIDIFKAICIILVVLGHSTGLFNPYVYQFHMAAFFFASGLTCKINKKTSLSIVMNKFFTILLPLMVMVILGTIGTVILYKTNVYQGLIDMPYLGFDTIPVYLKTGDLYLQFLGASWFLPTLIGVFLVQKIIILISRNKPGISYALLTIALYIVGVTLIKNGIDKHLTPFKLDLICIAQIFFAFGFAFSYYKEKIHIKMPDKLSNRKWVMPLGTCLLLCINIGFFAMFKYALRITMDFPSKSFPNFFWIILSALNGICFIGIISYLITLIPRKFRSWISFIGKNSLGVLFLHFIVFKIIMLIAYKNGAITQQELMNVVPPASLSDKFWPVFTLFGVAVPVIIWWGINKIPFINFLFGGDKKHYNSIYLALVNSKFGKKVCSIKTKIYKVL